MSHQEAKPTFIISTNFNLTESQNFLRFPKTQNKLLRISFGLYCAAIAPILIALLFLQWISPFKKYVKENEMVFLLVLTTMAILGYALGYSKILARKSPANYIFFVIFSLCLAYTCLGINLFLAKKTFHVFVIMFLCTGVSTLCYLWTLKNQFSALFAFMISFGFILISYICFGFFFHKKILLISGYFALSTFASFVITFGVEKLIKNKDYNLLKDDYVLVALKLLTVFPLIPHLVNEERTHDDE